MRIRVDRAADALYFRLDERRIVDSEEIRPGVEFLQVSKRATEEELTSLQFQSK
jgi:hypothetical protein